MNQKVHVACQFGHIFKNEGLLKVTASYYMWCNMSEAMPDRVVVTTDH